MDFAEKPKLILPKLYLVADRKSCKLPVVDAVASSLEAGVKIIQFRDKDSSDLEFLEIAKQIQKLCQNYNCRFLVNDRVEIAKQMDADGVHIGQSDLSIEKARKILGNSKILGLTVESFEELQAANSSTADYLGVSSIFPTPTKTDTKFYFGIVGLEKAVAITTKPLVAIGGIQISNAAEVANTGVDSLAFVSAVFSHENPFAKVKELLAIV